MSLGVVLLCLSILVLLISSAFFSSSETGLTAASEARMRALSRRGDKNAKAVEDLLGQKDKLISTLLIGNNLVNVVGTSLATSAAITLFAEGGVVLASIAMTILLVIFAEVLPKTYAFNHADRLALKVAKPVRIIVMLLTPLTWSLDHIVRLIIKPNVENDDSREEELRGMIELHGANTLDAETKEQSAMLSSVLDLGEVTVEEVMMHRASVEMINADNTPDDIFKAVMSSPYTRHPVYSGKPDNIVGVLHVKAMLRNLDQPQGEAMTFNVLDIAAEPYFVPETTLLIDQLQAFRKRREHFAIVVDEYGDFRGIVTLEDILEEIVGDIDDEHDVTLSGLRHQSDGSYIADGHLTIRDLNRALNWDLPDDDATTIAGLVIAETRIIPQAGQEFRFHGTRFRVLRRTKNKLDRIRVWREPTL